MAAKKKNEGKRIAEAISATTPDTELKSPLQKGAGFHGAVGIIAIAG